MARKTKEELNVIRAKYGVNELFSWSKYKCYKTDRWEYYLKYILHEKEDRTNGIYAVSGGYAHDIIEKFYEGKIAYEEMIDQYENYLLDMNLAELKYNRSDNDKNEAIAYKYENCLRHFFKHHIPITYPKKIEYFIPIKISDDIIFQGYIDLLHIEQGEDNSKNIIITDWKTSTLYTGKKVDAECGQLVVYAEGIRQALQIPLENIRCRWNFLKYVSVDYLQANGKWKRRNIERNKIGESLTNTAKMWLKKDGIEDSDIERYVDDMVLNNDLSTLPEEVKGKFVISDCYVEVPLSEEKINELKQDIIETVSDIRKRENEFKNGKDSGNEKIWWQEVTAEDEFRLNTLGGYSRKLHKPLDKYLKEKEVFDNKETDETNSEEDDLLDFLNNL